MARLIFAHDEEYSIQYDILFMIILWLVSGFGQVPWFPAPDLPIGSIG
jgi:hypothetical protein